MNLKNENDMNNQHYIVDEKYCRRVQDENQRAWRDAYGQINGRPYIGACMYLYTHKYRRPATYQAFYDAYTSDTHTTANDTKSYYRGRTHEELLRLAERFKTLANDTTHDVMMFYAYLVKKIIIDTFDGARREMDMHAMLEREGYRVGEVSDYDDTKNGIDAFAINEDNEIEFAVQLKPVSFFTRGNDNKYLVKDRLNAIEKTNRCYERRGVEMYYVLYSNRTNKLITNPTDGSMFFRIEELLDDDGHSRDSNNFLDRR